VALALPRPGERFEVHPAVADGLPTEDWWTAASGRPSARIAG
jgi:hypothetical protein